MSSESKKIDESLSFLKDDIESAVKQWTSGRQMCSLLQRSDMDFKELKEKFNSKDDEDTWCKGYSTGYSSAYLSLLRRRMAFMQAAVKEFSTEYDPDVTDVDHIRLLEVPFTDAKYVVDISIGRM